MFRRLLAAAVILLALASSATAFAAHGYRILVASQHRPSSGSLYSVAVHGVAKQKARVRLYLDRQPCRATWAREAKLNVTPFKAGQSYFRATGRPLITLRVNGRYDKAFTAHAGDTADTEYACAYLLTPNSQGQYEITASHASNTYYVTN